MLRNSVLAGALFAGILLAGCAVDDCGHPICGCWEDVTVSLEITVVDEFADPVEGFTAVCVNEDSPAATSGADGVLTATFDTRLSQECGTERCNTVTLLDPTGRCEGTQSTLLSLNRTTVSVNCQPAGDDDDSAR